MISDFKRLIQNGNLSHAYVFFGENLEEIFVFSQALANFLETNAFEAPKHYLNDLLVVFPNEKNNIGIDEIRNLRQFLFQKPNVSKKRTAVIYQAHNLTDEAQGALLKITEESPKDSLIILIVSCLDNLLATVVSRFQKFYFPACAGGPKADYSKILKAPKKSVYENPLVVVDETEEYFKKTIAKLAKEPKKNFEILKEVLKRHTLIKQLNLNKRLQKRLVDLYVKKALK